jgi:hypothetical protein
MADPNQLWGWGVAAQSGSAPPTTTWRPSKEEKILDAYLFMGQYYLVSPDGTGYFASKQLNCPPSLHILQQFARSPAYASTIHFFLNQVEVAVSTRYFRRWARRLREHGFSREDAAILALATFGTDVMS